MEVAGYRGGAVTHSHRVKNKLAVLSSAIILLFFVSFSTSAFAVEGGLGRPISGMSISPFAAVVPPEPGFLVSVGETYYDASIGAATTVPIANLLVTNFVIKASFTPVSLLYIWNTPTETWNFASAVGFPIAWLKCTANVSL